MGGAEECTSDKALGRLWLDGFKIDGVIVSLLV